MADISGRSPTAERFIEENRYLCIQSRLGANELLLDSFTGTEGISQLFSFQLELLSENNRIKFEDILGQPISFGINGPEGNTEPRWINGIVTAFSQLPETRRLSRYRAVVSPALWALTRRQNCRIFQNLSVEDILRRFLSGLDVVYELSGTHEKRDYCVQYRETDFNFISRLMEEEGIFYFFRHSQNTHQLVITDKKSSHRDIPGDASVVYEEVYGGLREENRILSWMKTQELGPGKAALLDYFFETPSTSLLTQTEVVTSVNVGKITHKLKVGGNDQFEIYDYPGGYEKKGTGENIVKRQMERMEMAQFTIHGESNSFQLIPGYRFNLVRHPDADGPYVVTSVTHSASEGGFHSGEESGEHYRNSFHVIPYDLPYRPRPESPKPRVYGCQTAVVVGPSGEEIYTDKYGRVKVHFHWDRDNQANESSSCWIRFATQLAGKGWGTIHIPRIGQEVLVDFLEGDPDHPLIVGAVYNSQQTPPFNLPGEKTKSGIKTQSSKGGGGYNQIIFEDLKGSEDIIIHAQKDMNVKIENDRNTTILKNETAKIQENHTAEIGKDSKTTIGKAYSINAGNEITMETGASKIVMKKSGQIEISGTNITIKASASLKLKGGKIDSEASGTHTIKGIVVNIN